MGKVDFSPHWVSGFFFQGEGGIRCLCVTGVQTCALPISGAWEGESFIIDVDDKRFAFPRTRRGVLLRTCEEIGRASCRARRAEWDRASETNETTHRIADRRGHRSEPGCELHSGPHTTFEV